MWEHTYAVQPWPIKLLCMVVLVWLIAESISFLIWLLKQL